jgi:pimeloyl-ACP methyl ester carboxylesterase
MIERRTQVAWARARAVVFGFAVAAVLFAAAQAAFAGPSACEPDGVQPGGAIYRICMPASKPWNGDLVIWAHGYVEVTRPVAIPEEQLCLGGGSFCVPDISNALGFGFITTSYRMNGMVTTGVEDVVELVDLFTAAHGAPRHVYLIGASEGGLVTALGAERRPDVFDGGLAACGPIGDFHRQIDYYGDFRVLFDYFFPGLIPGTPMSIPDDLIADFETFFNDTVVPVVFDPSNAGRFAQLLKTAHAPTDPNDPTSQVKTLHDGLWYNVMATNDITAKLGGPPFDNIGRMYRGSDDDAALNAAVARFAADPDALAAADGLFATSGNLHEPLVTLHTTMDQQVAFVQELLYNQKLRDEGASGEHVLVPAFRYGHCNFKPWEALLSFAILIGRVNGAPPAGLENLLPDPADRDAFLRAARQAGLLPARATHRRAR